MPVIDAFQIDRYPCDINQAFFGHRGDWGPLVMAWSIAHGTAFLRNMPHRHNPVPALQGVGNAPPHIHWRDPLYYIIVCDNSGVFSDVTLRMHLPVMQGQQDRKASVLNEEWSRDLTYIESTQEWTIEPHSMYFGDVNIWVIAKGSP